MERFKNNRRRPGAARAVNEGPTNNKAWSLISQSSRRVTRNTKVLIMVIAVAAIVIQSKNRHSLLVGSVTKDLPSQQNQMRYNQDNIRKRTSSIEEAKKGKQKHDNEVDGDYKRDDQTQSIPSKRTSSTGEDKKVYHDDKVDGDYKKDDVGKTPIKSGSQVDILPFDGIPSRFWTCQRDSADTEQKKRKLFFIHIFKTAGTSFRQFFRNYSQICNRRAVTIRCTSVLSESLANQTSEWMLPAIRRNRGPGYTAGPCVAGDFVDGDRGEAKRYNKRHHKRLFEKLSYSELQKYDVDIISGHTPIGLHSNWYTKKEKEVVTSLYITFFRDPVDRFVSSQLFKNKKLADVVKEEIWDFETALGYIVKVIKERKKSYDGLSDYLMTPAQKVGKQNITLAEKKNIMKSNLVDFPVIIGVIERMADSLDLIRYAINSDGNALVDKEIDSLDYQPIQNKTNDSRRRLLQKNKSKISTSAMVREIQKDTEVFAILKIFLRDEYEIYDYAMNLHKQQVERLSEIMA